MIFDTHCHLNAEEIFISIDSVLKRAKEVGVTKIIVPGWNKESSFLAVKLAEKYECVYAAVGFHPSDVIGVTDSDYDEVMNLLNHPKVVAVGEIGLDYFWEKDSLNKEKQRKWFIRQIQTANKYNLPIIIHNRDAYDDCLKILKENIPTRSGVMHCFSGSLEYLKEIINLNLYIGLDGPVTYKNAITPKEVAKIIPLSKLLVETDSPYLSPAPMRGKQNEPSYIKYIIDEIARLKNISSDEVSSLTFNNACKLFGISHE